MDAQGPPEHEDAPVGTEAPANESVEERHTRELSQSVEALEGTVETGVEHLLEKAIPFVVGVSVVCLGLYFVARRVRKRAARRLAAPAD